MKHFSKTFLVGALLTSFIGSALFAQDHLRPLPPAEPPVAQPLPPAEPQPPVLPPAKPSDSLLGTWNTTAPLFGRGVHIYPRFVFTNQRMSLTARCFFPATQETLSVSVDTLVRYENNDIYILEKKAAQVSDGNKYCTASTDYTRWSFYFDGTGQVVLFANAPYNARLNLVRE